MAKTLKNTSKKDWEDGIVEFSFEGVDYAVEVAKLTVKNLTPLEVKVKLNLIPAKFAYWSSLKNKAEQELDSLSEDFNMWMADKYDDLDIDKKTESWKKNQIILQNVGEYKNWKEVIRNLKYVVNQLGTIVSAYNMMTWTLREIARVMYAEYINIEAAGSGSLKDF